MPTMAMGSAARARTLADLRAQLLQLDERGLHQLRVVALRAVLAAHGLVLAHRLQRKLLGQPIGEWHPRQARCLQVVGCRRRRRNGASHPASTAPEGRGRRFVQDLRREMLRQRLDRRVVEDERRPERASEALLEASPQLHGHQRLEPEVEQPCTRIDVGRARHAQHTAHRRAHVLHEHRSRVGRLLELPAEVRIARRRGGRHGLRRTFSKNGGRPTVARRNSAS
jgi:hypothetical protein